MPDGTKKRKGNYAHVKAFRKRKKERLVAAHGGKCVVCGYDRCLRNLHFHHIDPSQKKIGLSTAGMGRSLDTVYAESKKCILVCSNCHGEIHDGKLGVAVGFKPTT